MKNNLLFLFFLIFCFGKKATGQELELVECFLSDRERPTKRIIEDQYGFIWLMRGEGFYRYDGKEIQFIQPSKGSIHSGYHSSQNILSLENGDYWLSANELGVAHYSHKDDQFYIYNHFEADGKTWFIYGRHVEDKDGKFKFISTTNGVFQIDNQGNLIRRIQPAIPFGAPNWGRHNANEVRKTVYDKKRNLLWIGGKVGLFSFDFTTEQLKWHPTPFNYPSLNSNGKWYLINDILLKDNELIMTSWAGGILTYQIKTEEWNQYVFEDEMDVPYRSGNTQFGESSNGRLFFAHETREVGSWKKGATNFSIPTVNNEVLGRGIGAQVDRLGFLWIGYWTNICKYNVTKEPPQAKTAQVYIKSIAINGKEQFQKMYRWDGRALKIDQKVDSLELTFRAIYPLNYDDIFYEYRLEGFDNNWKKNGQSEIKKYNKLKSGTYFFQVRYFDKISQQFIYTKKVKIIIDRIPWITFNQTLAILGLLFAAILGFLFSRHFFEKKRQREELKYQQQLREVQDAALRSQMNPHFLFNSLNSIRYFIVTNDNDKAAGYLTKFSRLIRMILENSKKKLVPLKEEIQLLDLYVKMEQIRFENKFDYIVHMDKNIDQNEFLIPPMLIQPYIENAIIHGINPKDNKGTIQLSFQLNRPFLVIEIEDDGIGREQSMEHKKASVFKKKSLGLSITKARLNLADSPNHTAKLNIIDLKDEQENGIGTKVIIQLPV